MTVEVAPGYESDRTRSFNPDTLMFDRETEEGFSNIEFGVRHPIFQYVSPDRFFDTTFVFGMEVALPSGSKISRDTELVPKIFNLTRLGDHFAIQTGFGDSILVGPEEGGLNVLEYSAVFGYEITH